MSMFKSIIDVVGDGSYAGEIVELISKSTVGSPSDSCIIVGDVQDGEIDKSSYTCYTISKIQWETSDGKFYSDPIINHKFIKSGVYQVKLSVWSEPFLTGDGRKFYFVDSSYLDVTVNSKILKDLLYYNPTWELTKNNATLDFYKASANFFEKIHSDIGGLFDLWDADTINPKFFEYLSLTLGHDSNYAKKIGYDMKIHDFETYDIYDRIKLGKASKEEIASFRRFLIFSSELFRKKGSPQNIEKFLSLFTINAKSIELWTRNWGQTPIGEIDENFIGFDFENNKHGFVWDNIRVIGNCTTDKGYIKKNLSSIIIDNYHDIQKVSYPSDVVSTVYSGDKVGWHEIELDKHGSYIFDVRNSNGRILVDESEYKLEPDVYDIVPNTPPRSDIRKSSVLQIKPDTVENGSRLSVVYYGAEDSTFDSILMTKERKVKDFDMKSKFVIRKIEDPNKFENFKYPENEVFILFRGVKSNVDLYATVDEYYKIIVNGARGTCTLVKVIYNGANVVYQKLNISGDKNLPIYDSQIIKSDNASCPTELEYDVIYELEVKTSGSLISAYLYKNEIETQIQNNFDSDVGGNVYNSLTCQEPIILFENVNLDQDASQILTHDAEGNDVIDKKYTYIDSAGHYGFGVRSSIIELKDFYINILDADETLYTTTEKEFNLMPKFLGLKNKQMRFNNYSKESDVFYSSGIVDNFDPTKTDYDVDTKSLNFIYGDGVNITEEVSTRYTITFDESWMKENFSTPKEVSDKIIIPFGKQRKWFVPEMRWHNNNLYRNYYGSYDVVDSNEKSIPGLFRYNESVILDTYDLEPGDQISTLTRINALTFKTSNKIAQYNSAKIPLGLKGVFQEVCPHSGNFEFMGNDIRYTDGTLYKNPIFQPITINTSYGARVVGVRFRNCDDIDRLIAANATDIYKSVQLYGLFSMDVSAESIRYAPDKTKFTAHPSLTDTYVVKFFVPLGILDRNIRTYSLNSEFLQIESNSGSDLIRIEGIYVRNPKDKIKYNQSDETITLNDRLKNPYESEVDNLLCKFYLSGEMKLATKIQSFDYGDSFPTTYILGEDVRRLLNGIESDIRPGTLCSNKQSKYTYDVDYRWWLPSSVWMRREVKRVSASYKNDIMSGINYNKNQFDKFFYNLKMESGSQKPKALSYKLLDGNVNKNTVYYAKVNVYLNYSGFKYREIADIGSASNPIDIQELESIEVKEGTRKVYNDFRRSPVGTCSTFYIPISWYPEKPLDNNIEWFNYITGSSGVDESSPSVTITPIGLMTYLINNAGDSNRTDSISINGIVSTTRDWSIEEWNKLFDENVEIEFIAEEVPKDKYKLFDKYAILPSYPINVGSEIKIKYNVADKSSVGWEVYDDYTIYAISDTQKIFNIPSQLKSVRRWAEDITSITLNKLIIPPTLYDIVSDSKIRFLKNDLTNSLNGCRLVGRYYFDIMFDDNVTVKTEDDFNVNKIRTIKLLPYESDKDGAFSSVSRKPNTNLVFNSRDNIYNLENINNRVVFRSINSNSFIKRDYKRNGVTNMLNNEVSFSKKAIDNVSKLYVIDDNNVIFDISSTFMFDKKLGDTKNYDGKKFEYILKAETVYDPKQKKNILGSYYFVGVGVYNFDIGIGIARYNPETGNMDKSFLAGFGEYNTRGVEVDKWYKLRTIVTDDFIRVLFNESGDSERLVINYNIRKNTQNQKSRYIDGSFEELVYIVTGLDKMSITYPGKLGEKTTDLFAKENFNEELVSSFRPSGTVSGVVFHNELTYMSDIQYISQIQGNKTYGNTHDATDRTVLLEQMRRLIGTDAIKYIGKTLSGTTVIHSDQYLLYMLHGGSLSVYSDSVSEVYVSGEYVIVRYDTEKSDFEIVDQNFVGAKSVYVKDLSFNIDHIFNYLKFTNRKIRRVWAGKNKIYIEFCGIADCIPWGETYWNRPVWGCFGSDELQCG